MKIEQPVLLAMIPRLPFVEITVIRRADFGVFPEKLWISAENLWITRIKLWIISQP
jgi:hypothetical protein